MGLPVTDEFRVQFLDETSHLLRECTVASVDSIPRDTHAGCTGPRELLCVTRHGRSERNAPVAVGHACSTHAVHRHVRLAAVQQGRVLLFDVLHLRATRRD